MSAIVVEERMLIRIASKKTLEPLGDIIVIRPTAADVTEAGLIVPDSVEDRKKMLVIAVGPGKLQDDGFVRPMGVKVGDWVICAPGTARGIDITGEVLYLAHESDVVARVLVAESA